jgi:hypothetical protein
VKLPEPRSGEAESGATRECRCPCISDCRVAGGLWSEQADEARGERVGSQGVPAASERAQVRVERFGRGPVAECLAGAAVERGGDGFDLLGAPSREVGALGEVLAQQPVGVLVAGALPRAVRVGEVDRDISVDLQLGVLGQFLAAVQVNDRRSCAGNVVIFEVIGSRMASAP